MSSTFLFSQIENNSYLRVEVFDTIVPAYQIRKHLSGIDKEIIGSDTLRVTKFFYERQGKKVWIKYKEIEKLTNNSVCYWGYTENKIPCDNIFEYKIE